MNEALFSQPEPGRIGEIADRLREASAVTAALFSDVVREACWRLPSLRRTRDFDRLQQLIECRAWIDAALTLLELELPQWQLRRIVYDGGEWHCALSRRGELPDWLDQPCEASHADLPIAILGALLDIQATNASSATDNSAANAPRADEALYVTLCCDNFA
jgi:hypothetical protein